MTNIRNASSTAAAERPGAPRVAVVDQAARLGELRARLSADDRAIIDSAIARMTPDQVERWLATLAAISVDDAVAKIRAMVARQRLALIWRPLPRAEVPS